MDYIAHFRREAEAFEAAARRASREAGADGAPLVPSCPGWSMADLVFHLGAVHRYVIRVIGERLRQRPDEADFSFLRLPADYGGWPDPDRAPHRAPLPPDLLDWFREGADTLAELFASCDPAERVWSWAPEQSVGFWLRMQAIEAAVHRWDAENALGTAGPVDRLLAADAVTHSFEVMAPARRAQRPTPPGEGERMRFRQSDGFRVWVVQTDPEEVLLNEGTGCCLVELTATASELMLFLWHRITADGLEVRGDAALLDRYFKLVPPL
ncbi:maleylpyruvate isomerase family mycothiol-dependent enzyme [Streptomyces sp. NPDC059070]|uniref:maleylpyruvate isomerase family mycothiol-dependent enzyme n=1 Tax=Streptomyces sp. NPDC059070 TaxID=3346713 RepID=UPI0036BC74C7